MVVAGSIGCLEYQVMRRYLAFWIVSGFLISAGGSLAAASPSVAAAAEDASVEAPAAGQRGTHLLGIRDEAAMILVGTFLIGLAGAVRRAA